MKIRKPIQFHLRPIYSELVRPSNYILAGIVGFALTFVRWDGAYTSVSPFLLAFSILLFFRSASGYKNRQLKMLIELPAQRLDPAFVMDQEGKISFSAGHTRATFKKNRIRTLFDIFDTEDVKNIIAAGLDNSSDKDLSCYSAFLRKWYRVRIKSLPPERHMLVWFEDITDQKMADLSLSVIRGFSDEIITSIDQLVKKNDSYERLCRLIFKEGYEGVFISREDSQGDLSGHVCKSDGGQLCLSEPITIDKKSHAPIWRSKRSKRVVTATINDLESREEFEKNHPFDDRVKQFVGSQINNYVNYHEGDLSIIAFNKRDDIGLYDLSVMETLGNTARSITRLVDVAIESDEKFLQIITGLCAAAEYSDELTGKHILRVNEYAKLLARSLDRSPVFIERIGKVAALHDIGKVAIPNIIKLKRTLDPIELSEMRMHTIYGAQIINKMISLSKNVEPRLEMARAIALNHHQQWDGSGYPGLIDDEGRLSKTKSKAYQDYGRFKPLKGSEIPVEALIVSLADKYDALRNSRSYKSALSHKEACDLLKKDDRGGKTGEEIFGADIFSVFLDISDDFDVVFEEMKDTPE